MKMKTILTLGVLASIFMVGCKKEEKENPQPVRPVIHTVAYGDGPGFDNPSSPGIRINGAVHHESSINIYAGDFVEVVDYGIDISNYPNPPIQGYVNTTVILDGTVVQYFLGYDEHYSWSQQF